MKNFITSLSMLLSVIVIVSCNDLIIEEPQNSLVQKFIETKSSTLTDDEIVALKIQGKENYTISKEDALRNITKYTETKKGTPQYKVLSCTLKATEKGNPLYYETIIESSKGKGYALLSSDARVPEVLCFVETGSLSDTTYNNGLKLYLNMAREYIQYQTSRKLNVDSLALSAQKKLNPYFEEQTKAVPAFDPDVWIYDGIHTDVDDVRKEKIIPVDWGWSPYCVQIGHIGICSVIATAQLLSYYGEPYKDLIDEEDWPLMISDSTNSLIAILYDDIYHDLYWLWNSAPPFMSDVRNFLIDNDFSCGSIVNEFSWSAIMSALDSGPTIISGMSDITDGHYWNIDGAHQHQTHTYEVYYIIYNGRRYEYIIYLSSTSMQEVRFNWGYGYQSNGWYSPSALKPRNSTHAPYDSYIRIINGIEYDD